MAANCLELREAQFVPLDGIPRRSRVERSPAHLAGRRLGSFQLLYSGLAKILHRLQIAAHTSGEVPRFVLHPSRSIPGGGGAKRSGIAGVASSQELGGVDEMVPRISTRDLHP
jgi:hypothetical protein